MNVFDILGPVMIGPSSSHTAGAARIGLITRTLLGKPPVRASILLHGSFAKTYKGHGTDKAIVAGLLGMQAHDERIRFSLEEAEKEGLLVEIYTADLDDAHPNTAEITLTSEDGTTVSLRGSSIGGGYYGDKSKRYGRFPYRSAYYPDCPSQRYSRNDCCCHRAHGRLRRKYL